MIKYNTIPKRPNRLYASVIRPSPAVIHHMGKQGLVALKNI